MPTYTVYYRTGGTENFKWLKTLPVPTREEAIDLQKTCEAMGYQAHYEDTQKLESIGLPDTYNAIAL